MRRLIILLFASFSLLASGQKPSVYYGYFSLHDKYPYAYGHLGQLLDAQKGPIAAIPCQYRSTDQHGEEVWLSGKVYVPKNEQAKGIILLPHYTVAANKEVPSECNPIEARLAKKGYAVVMPDYLGYGATSVWADTIFSEPPFTEPQAPRVHPYLDAKLTARNSVDMLLAAKEYIRNMGVKLENDSLIIVGFSQGAAAAIASLRLLEEEYPEVAIKKCYAGSGPYDVCATYDDAVRRNRLGMAVVVPMLVMGTSEAYDLHLRPEDFFTPYMLARYEQIVYIKNKGLVEWAFSMPSHKLSKYMTKEGMDKKQPETARMYDGFKRSSIVYTEGDTLVRPDWKPSTPIYLFHSTNDDIVCFDCAVHLHTFLAAQGCEVTTQFGRYGGHLSSLFRYMRILKKEL